MIRRLTFDGGRGPRRFALLYEALLQFGDGQQPRSRAILRQEARLLEQLEHLSVPDLSAAVTCKVCGREGNVDMRSLAATAGVLPAITIAQEDHELLVRYVDVRPWLPRVARDVVDLMDWLGAAEKIEA